MSTRSDERLDEIVTWWNEHVQVEKSIDNEINFLKTVIKNLLILHEMILNDLRGLEDQKQAEAQLSQHLWLPTNREMQRGR